MLMLQNQRTYQLKYTRAHPVEILPITVTLIKSAAASQASAPRRCFLQLYE